MFDGDDVFLRHPEPHGGNLGQVFTHHGVAEQLTDAMRDVQAGSAILTRDRDDHASCFAARQPAVPLTDGRE